MPKEKSRKSFPFNSPGNYRIRVLGALEESWSEKLGGLRITTGSMKDQTAFTDLVGRMRDQAELAGVLNSLYELHLTLLSVEYLNGD